MKTIGVFGFIPLFLMAFSFTCASANDCSVAGLPEPYQVYLKQVQLRKTSDRAEKSMQNDCSVAGLPEPYQVYLKQVKLRKTSD